MVGEETAMETQVLAKHGKGVREIARELASERRRSRFGTSPAKRHNSVNGSTIRAQERVASVKRGSSGAMTSR